MLREHLLIRLQVLQVSRLTGLQLLLALERLGYEGIAEFRVLQSTLLIFVKVNEEKLEGHRIKIDADFSLECFLELLLANLSFGGGVQLSESINCVELS